MRLVFKVCHNFGICKLMLVHGFSYSRIMGILMNFSGTFYEAKAFYFCRVNLHNISTQFIIQTHTHTHMWQNIQALICMPLCEYVLSISSFFCIFEAGNPDK